MLYWTPLLVFLAHVAEEAPRFPAWATRHFGATSVPWFVYSHIVLIGALATMCGLAAGSAHGSIWALLATGAQWVLFTNALFHVATTVLFREYSPGVVTATMLLAPGTIYVLLITVRDALLSRAQLAVAIALGTVVGALVIASLWLPMNVDWRLRHNLPVLRKTEGDRAGLGY